MCMNSLQALYYYGWGEGTQRVYKILEEMAEFLQSEIWITQSILTESWFGMFGSLKE